MWLVPKTLDKGEHGNMFCQYLAELNMAYSDNRIPQGSEKQSTAAEYTDANIPT